MRKRTITSSGGVESPQLKLNTGHTGVVVELVFSPDGKTIASAGYDGTVILWDVSTGNIQRKLSTQVNHHTSVAFSPDERLIVASNCYKTWLWLVESGKPLLFSEELNNVVSFTADGQGLIGWTDWTEAPVIWDIKRSEPAFRFPFRGNAMTVTYSRNILAIMEDQTVRLFSLQTRETLLQFDMFEDATLSSSLLLSPDGSLIVIPYGESTVIYETASGKPVLTLPAEVAAAFSPDGNALATHSGSGQISLWDSETLDLLSSVDTRYESIRALAFSPDGSILAGGGDDRSVGLWAVRSGRSVRELSGYPYSVEELAFSPDGCEIHVKYADETVLTWGHTQGPVRSVAALKSRDYVSPDNRTKVQVESEGHLLVIDVPSNTIWLSGILCPALLPVIAFSSDGRLLAIGINTDASGIHSVGHDTISVWDITTRQQLFILPVLRDQLGQIEGIIAALFSSDNAILAVGYDGYLVAIWDARTGSLIHKLSICGDFASHLSFSPDNKTLAIGTDYSEIVQLFSVQAGREKRRLEGHSGNITGISFSPDGKLFISGSDDGAVKLWNPLSGKLLATLMPLSSARNENAWIVYTPEGEYDCSVDAEIQISWYAGNDILPARAFAGRFKRQGLIAQLLERE